MRRGRRAVVDCVGVCVEFDSHFRFYTIPRGWVTQYTPVNRGELILLCSECCHLLSVCRVRVHSGREAGGSRCWRLCVHLGIACRSIRHRCGLCGCDKMATVFCLRYCMYGLN